MKIDISDLIQGGRSVLDMDIRLDEDYISGGGFLQKSPIHLTGKVEWTGKEFILDLLAEATVEEVCDRCTRTFTANLVFPIWEEMDLPPEQKNKSDQLDITELIRDNILVQLPTKTLCSPDCKGLCPVCGKDRNEFDCTCESEQIDPRLSVLNNLLNEDE